MRSRRLRRDLEARDLGLARGFEGGGKGNARAGREFVRRSLVAKRVSGGVDRVSKNERSGGEGGRREGGREREGRTSGHGVVGRSKSVV